MERPLAPIEGGIVEGLNPGEQPAGTAYYAANVRSRIPSTGERCWISQRPGLTRVGNAFPDGGFATHLFNASKLRRARELVSLTTTADPAVDPQQVEFDWLTDVDDFAVDVATGPDGQGYYLLRSGEVAIVNKRGSLVDQVPSSTPVRFDLVPRVYAGRSGGVYVAYTRDDPITDDETGQSGAGRIVRWVRGVDGLWERAWTAVIPGRISTFAFHLQYLWWAEDPGAEDDERGELPAAIGRISNPLLGPEFFVREELAPWPVVDIQITDLGAAIVSAPANSDRGEGGGITYTARGVGFTPPELLSWPLNSWAWIEKDSLAESEDVPVDGDEILELRDKRKDETDFDPIGEDEPDRTLVSRVHDGFFTRPKYLQTAFGGFGGISFDDSAVMYSEPNADIADPEQQLAIIPGSFGDFAYYTIVEFTEEQAEDTTTIRQIASQRSLIAGQPSWRLVAQGLDVSLVDLNNGITVGPISVKSASRAAVIAVEHPGVGQNLRLSVNGEVASAGDPSPAVLQGGEQFFSDYPEATDAGPRFTRGRGFYNEMNLFRAAATQSGSSGNFSRALDNDVDTASGAADGQWTLRVTWAAPRPEFDAVSLVAQTDAPRVAFSVRGVASGNPTQIEAVSVETDSDGFVRHELKLSEDWDINAYDEVLIVVSADTQNSTTLPISVFDLSAREYSSNNVPSALYNWGEDLSLRVLTLGDHQKIEGYFAHKYGIGHELRNQAGELLEPEAGGHPFSGAGNVPGGTGDSQIQADVIGIINSVDPMVVKYAQDGRPVAALRGPGVGLGTGISGKLIWTYGDPSGTGNDDNLGSLILRLRDRGLAFEQEASIQAAAVSGGGFARPFQRGTPIKVGPRNSLFIAYDPSPTTVAQRQVRRYDGTEMSLTWALNVSPRVVALDVAGAQLDAVETGGDFGPEFLYVARDNPVSARRLDVLGLRDNQVREGRDVDTLAVTSSGTVYRLVDGTWDLVEAAALPGDIVGSATIGGRTVLADGIGYRVWDHNLRQLRDFEEAVSGEFPSRCKLIANYRNRLVVARGDEAFTLYFSEVGEPLNFVGRLDAILATDPIAGTTARNGRAPEEITALMPFRDDQLWIGTTEGLYVLNGDLASGGQIDQVDRSQGVAFGYAWCESPRGIYYFSSRGGVVLISPNGALQLASSERVQRRLEELDLSRGRVRMSYNWIDATVHVFYIPFDLRGSVEHVVLEEVSGGWVLDTYGPDFGDAVTTCASLIGDAPEERSLLIGKADGRTLRFDQYAHDDDGLGVDSEVTIGPLASDSENVLATVRGVYATLKSDLAGIEVAVRTSNTPDAPGPCGPFQPLSTGKGFGASLNATAPYVWITLRGTGPSWAAYGVRADIRIRGKSRVAR